jgi:hypothetical protein
MSRSQAPASRLARTLSMAGALVLTAALPAGAQGAPGTAQAIDEAYTAKIREYLSDPRISTELVDHLPASSTVPSPLAFHGRIVGTPGELTRAADIHRYFKAVADASPRVAYWTVGKSEEGRDMVLVAIADSATIANLDRHKDQIARLTDPRRTTEAEARQLLQTAKPIYYVTTGIHSPETGGPEMVQELVYRLAVQETPFIDHIRQNVITLVTPVVEVDGREKMVDTYYWNKKNRATLGNLPLMYWGKYVQHDNNRDGMGQFLALTKNVTNVVLDWKPTVLHDLHEAATYLYSSTGTGPYNEAVDPITTHEWWMLAQNDVLEMTKRGVPGVWTYGFYDGWVPNYLFFIAHTHNSIGRFYEVQSYGPDPYVVRPGATTTSREWFRPNPPLDSISWSPRANTNIQQSALLLSLSHVAKNRQLYLENYWLKNKRAVAKGSTGPLHAWVIPARQHAKQNAAEAVNDLRAQGLEVHVAKTAFTAGGVQVQPGDYVIRGDQPYRTIADMYFSLQSFSPSNPSPYDDTGWTFPLMRNITVAEVTDASVLKQPMDPVTGVAVAPGGITGTGNVVVVENTSDNALVTFRFRHANVAMEAAEAPFEAAGRRFGAGAFIIRNADRARLEPELRRLGLSGYAMASAPSVATHPLDVPRIGYVHSWSRTQDEGWWRAAFDTYGVPYDYFGEPELKRGNLRAKYDVIVYPYGGTGLASGGGGGGGGGRGGATGPAGNGPVPYQRTTEFPSLGYPDSTSDIRGGVGVEGFRALHEFVRQGGTIITEGNTAQNLLELGFAPGVTVEPAQGLFARGSIMRGEITDRTSPLVYGYEHDEVPVYFNMGPVLNAGAGAKPVQVANARGGGRTSSSTQNVTPMANRVPLAPWDPDSTGRAYGVAAGTPGTGPQRNATGGGRGGFGGGPGGGGAAQSVARDSLALPDAAVRTRVVMQFPEAADDMLLSGTLENGQLLSRRAQLVDQSIGQGHVVVFAIRPFWRWQTQGNYALGFNAILHWNDLGAGQRAGAASATSSGQ